MTSRHVSECPESVHVVPPGVYGPTQHMLKYPATKTGPNGVTISVANCPNCTHVGNTTRTCLACSSSWGAPVLDCKIKECPEDEDEEDTRWPSTQQGLTVSLPCPCTHKHDPTASFSGKRRTCIPCTSQWSIVKDACLLKHCPALEEWPRVPQNTSLTISCPREQIGFMARHCKECSEEWDGEITNECVHVPFKKAFRSQPRRQRAGGGGGIDRGG